MVIKKIICFQVLEHIIFAICNLGITPVSCSYHLSIPEKKTVIFKVFSGLEAKQWHYLESELLFYLGISALRELVI